MATTPFRFRLRRGTSTEWATANPILLDGEPAVERDTGAFKLGNGADRYNTLPYSGENTVTLLARAAKTATDKIAAENIQAIRNDLETIKSSGTSGTTYNDTQLREDMAAADSSTLTSAKTYADQGDQAVKNLLPDMSLYATKSDLNSYQLASTAATDTEVETARSSAVASAKTYTDAEVLKDRNRLSALEGRPKPQVMTQAAYDALATKDSTVLYFITA